MRFSDREGRQVSGVTNVPDQHHRCCHGTAASVTSVAMEHVAPLLLRGESERVREREREREKTRENERKRERKRERA